MRTTRDYKYALIIIVLFLCCGCDQLRDFFYPDNAIVTYNGPAHLKITNIDTGETAEDQSTISIGGDKYDLIASRLQSLEIEFIPNSGIVETDGEYTIDFELFDTKKTVTQSPYKFQHTIDKDVPNGTYPITCSAMNSNWTDDSSCKQVMFIRIQ